MTDKVGRVGGQSSVAQAQVAPSDPRKLFSSAEQKDITALIAAERKNQPVMRSGGVRAAASSARPPIAARYLAPPPEIISLYVAPPPWVSIDAHVALINRVTCDRYLNIKEARLIRKLFNHDIADASRRGINIRPRVAAYLRTAFTSVRMSKTGQELVFGKGGPGHKAPEPIYILPPPGGGGPIYYILPPTRPGTR